MKLNLSVVVFCLFLFNASGVIAAPSTPIMVVAGKVMDVNGNSITKGITVMVENQTNKTSLETAIGDNNEEGTYTITFVNFQGKSVAASNDSIKVSVKDKRGGILASEIYQLKDEDIIAAYVRIDLKVQNLIQSTPIFVVAGIIVDEVGDLAKELKDFTAIIENQTNGLIEKVKLSDIKGNEGKYTATFFNFEGKKVASVDDLIKVSFQNPAGVVILFRVYQLKETDIAAAQAIINLRVSTFSATAIERKGNMYATWATMKIRK